MAAQTSQTENGMASCRVCREPIRASASKCIKCGSYQDWTRHLLRWSALLVSLLALAPLWSIADSLSRLAFTDKAANIEAVVTRCSRDEVRAVFENSGEVSGIVTRVDFAIRTDGEKSVPRLEVRNSLDHQDILVSPGAPPVRANYRAYIDNTPASFLSESRAERDCAYLIDIHWIDFSGSEQLIAKECRCP